MAKNNDNRVLGRENARDLTAEEVDKIRKGNRIETLHFTSVFFPDT